MSTVSGGSCTRASTAAACPAAEQEAALPCLTGSGLVNGRRCTRAPRRSDPGSTVRRCRRRRSRAGRSTMPQVHAPRRRRPCRRPRRAAASTRCT
jgi:hypothetical protein